MSQGSPGYNATLYLTGTSTAMTDEACTENTTTEFQVTDTAKRILDHDVVVVVKVNTIVQSSGYSVDYNTGIVTFTSSQTGNTVTVTANYLPRHAIAKVRIVTCELSYDAQDSGVLGDAGEANTLTLLRVRMGVESIDVIEADVYGTTNLAEVFAAKSIKVLEFGPTGTGQKVIRARGSFASSSWANNGPAGIATKNLSFVGGSKSTTLVSYASV